jgi:tRNA A37 threonylcarbamoyladenosine synthetase subunit TsaC/SUA5/YrdC
LDLIIDGGTLPSRVPSTVIAFEDNNFKILREGAIPYSKIQHVIGSFRDERERE